MFLLFSNVEYLDPDVAKFNAWLIANSKDSIPTDITALSSSCSVSREVLLNNSKIQQLLRIKDNAQSDKSFRTPLSDWKEIPFLIDKHEQPMSAANAWLRHISKKGSPKTWRTYGYDLFDFFQYLEWRNIDWDKIDDETLVSYRLRQETTDSNHKKKHKGDRRVSKKTIQARLLTVGRFYKYAAKHGFLEKPLLTFEAVLSRRPADVVFLAHVSTVREREIPLAAYSKIPKNPPPKWLPHETVWTWINSIKDTRDKLMAKLLYQTGMRREEIILWRVRDIPVLSALTTSEASDWVKFSIRGKGGRNRTISISAKNFLQLRHWIDVDRKKILKKCGINVDEDHGFVWVAQGNGHPLQAISLNHIFQRVSEACGVRITPHMLRHSFALEKRMALYEAGIPNPEKKLQEALGHANVVTTMTIYGHVSPEFEVKEAESNTALLRKLGFENNDEGPEE